jgi:hypothetical protein
MPAGFSVDEYARALGASRLGPGTMLDLRGPAFVAFFARLTASTDPAFFDVVTDPAEGSLVPPARIDALAGVDVTRTHFPGAGHAISPFFPDQSARDIRAFLRRLPR